jgi:hypothetical protein
VKCGKKGYWYALCPTCRKKIDEAYKKAMEELNKGNKKP